MPDFTKTLNLEKPLRGEFYSIEKHNENSEKIDFAIEKITVPTIEHLQNMIELQVGDIVDIQGYYTAGDGAHHKRKIESADDGSGVQLTNGMWANIIHNGEVNVVCGEQEKIINFCKQKKIKLIFDEITLTQETDMPNFSGKKIISGNKIKFSNDVTEVKNVEIIFTGKTAPYSENVLISGNDSIKFKNVIMRYGDVSRTGLGIKFESNKKITIDNISFENFQSCIRFEKNNKEINVSNVFGENVESLVVCLEGADNERIRAENLTLKNSKEQSELITGSDKGADCFSGGAELETFVKNVKSEYACERSIYTQSPSNHVVCDLIVDDLVKTVGSVRYTDTNVYNVINSERIIIDNIKKNNSKIATYNNSDLCIYACKTAVVTGFNDYFNVEKLTILDTISSTFETINLRDIYSKAKRVVNFSGSPTLFRKGSGVFFDNNTINITNVRAEQLTHLFSSYAFWENDSQMTTSININDSFLNFPAEKYISIGDGKNRINCTLKNTTVFNPPNLNSNVAVHSVVYDNCTFVFSDNARYNEFVNNNFANNNISVRNCKIRVSNTWGDFEAVCNDENGVLFLKNVNAFFKNTFVQGFLEFRLGNMRNENLLIESSDKYRTYTINSSGAVVDGINGGFTSMIFPYKVLKIMKTDINNTLKFTSNSKSTAVVYSSTQQLNTPYHATKMQQEGVYEDFISYMDELHEYEKAQSQAVEGVAMMNELVEPQPSQALLDFKKKYLG